VAEEHGRHRHPHRVQARKWPENLKAARAGKLMMWALGSLGATPDGQGSLSGCTARRPAARTSRASSCRPSTASTSACRRLPDGPEREALFAAGQADGRGLHALQAARAPHVTDMTQPWLLGYRRPLFWQDWWHMVDIDTPCCREE
jgi:hypothetical protein